MRLSHFQSFGSRKNFATELRLPETMKSVREDRVFNDTSFEML